VKSAAALLVPALLGAQVAQFRVHETAGLRRFSYPVRGSFATSHAPDGLRLLEEGKPVAAQFTAREPGRVEVDFAASLGPHESRRYRVDAGAPAAAAEGMRVEETDSSYRVRHPNGLEFEVPRNLLGMLKAARTPRTSYLLPDSQGLVAVYRDDIEFRAGGIGHWGTPTRSRVVKAGPLACALRFEGMQGLRGDRSVASVVEMEFPRSKSWVEIVWTVEDPQGFVSGLIADLNLNIQGPPTLVDFGATSMAYVALRKDQAASFVAAREGEWRIDVGGQPYASGSGVGEGWAHVMDSERATAVALAEFTRAPGVSRERIDVSPQGRLVVRRDFRGGERKSLRFWLHFVGMPVQVGAATSPQSMQAPLEVVWE